MEKTRKSKGRKVFLCLNYVIVAVITLSCMIPLLNLLAMSFSSSQAIIENRVFLLPVDFTTRAYEYVLKNKEFWTSVMVSAKRVLLGVPLNVVMTILVAYPLSKSDHAFPARKYYVAFMLVAMLFNGGLMPTYFIVAKTGLIDTIWSLVLPGAVPIFSCIVLMNFFRGVPEELEESEGAPSSPQAARLNTIAEASIRLITFFFIIFLLSIDFDSHTGTLYLYSSHDWIRVYNTVPYVTT